MALSKFSEQLDTYLKDKSDIKIFDFPKHEKNLKCIGKGGFGIVYSITFEEENYALKSFKQSEELDENEFKDFMKEYLPETVLTKLLNKEKEGTISGTPKGYADIYTKCWSFEPRLRPNLDEILENLLILSEKTADFTIINKLDNLSDFLDRLFYDFADSTNKGLEFSQISKRIRDIINLENQKPQNTFNCLYNKENNNNSEWICLLGFFYLEGIGTGKNQITARNTFEKARNGNTNGSFMAKFYLGECLRNAYGTEKNLASAKLLYKDIRGECARAANSLGLCYLKGIGCKTKRKAIRCFEESYEK
ncbi:21194_t:CDS:2, partial [Dentiscutata erythropus]